MTGSTRLKISATPTSASSLTSIKTANKIIRQGKSCGSLKCALTEPVVLEGDVIAVSENGEKPLDKGDVLLIPAGEKHQFKNRSDMNPASFICLVPIEYQT